MRKLLPLLAVAFISSATLVFAAAEVTITGEGQCAKCSLKETAKCQNAIVVEKDGKKETYYLAKNKVANAFHKNICQETKTVKATGEVEEKDGKKIMTASKIEVVE